MMASPTIIVVVVLYLIVMLAIGYWASKNSDDVAGYYVAGKKLPSWVVAFSMNATGESAWLILGLTGMGYMMGAHAFWVILGEVMGVTLAWVLVARPFKEYTDRYDAITVPDYLEKRFRDTTHILRIIGALIIFSMAAVYIAAQVTASGKAFESFLGMSYETGAIVGAAIILYYTSVGGFKAVAYTDLIQGLLMAACLFVLPIVGIYSAGGWSDMMAKLGEIDPNLLLPMGEHGLSGMGIASALGFVAIGIAFLGSPQLLVRFMSAKSTHTLTKASPISVCCVIIFDLGAILAGMAGRALFPVLDDPETIYPLMGMELFPAVFTGIFLVVVLAAIMSTADSLLILASSAVVRDVVQKIVRPDWADKTFLHWGKAVTVILGLIALVLALQEVRVIFWFVLFAWSGLACAFTPVILCSLFWKRTTLAGAIAGMICGFVITILWVFLFKSEFYDLYEMIPGFVGGLIATVGVSLFTTPPAGADKEFDDVHKTVGSAFRAGVDHK
jgi:sodium/proline symporter